MISATLPRVEAIGATLPRLPADYWWLLGASAVER